MIYNFIVRNMNIINSIQSSLSNSLPWSLVDDHLLNFLQMTSTTPFYSNTENTHPHTQC